MIHEQLFKQLLHLGSSCCREVCAFLSLTTTHERASKTQHGACLLLSVENLPYIFNFKYDYSDVDGTVVMSMYILFLTTFCRQYLSLKTSVVKPS